MNQHHKILVIGAGPGGYIAALRAAAMGADTAIIEKHYLGGTCLNYGCIPSKALLSSAELLHHVQHASDWGIEIAPGSIGHNWAAIQKKKDKTLRQLRGGIGALLKARAVTHYQGTAKFDGPGAVTVTPEKGDPYQVTADKVIIAVGSSPIRIPGWPDDPQTVATSDESVHWNELPKKLLIVGGGVIGCEFACMMQPFGVEVTIVEMLDELLGVMDADLGAELRKTFTKRGITSLVGTKVESMSLGGSGALVQLSDGQTLDVDKVLVCIGRKPNTKEIGLDAAGVETTQRGFIEVNDFMETTQPGHYCIGDANGLCLLAHAASAHGICAVENALGHRHAFDHVIPSAVYTFPEIGAVGMTEAEARATDDPIAIGLFSIATLGKAMATNHAYGFVKTIRNRTTGKLLGVHMIGHNATECIAAAGAMLDQDVSVNDLAETVFAHPTISEAIKESAEDAMGYGLHQPPKKVLQIVAEAG